VEPASPSQDILYDHRDLVLHRAIGKGRDNVTICRLGIRIANWEPGHDG
jgi:hypothetical protein